MKKSLFVAICLIFMCISITACTTNNNNESKDIYIGEKAINSENVEFIVTSVVNTKEIGYSTTPDNYLIITIKITNNGKSSWSQNPLNCVLKLNEATYEYSSKTYLLEDGMDSLDTINPGISKTMSIVFEVPTRSDEELYILKIKGYSLFKDDSVSINLTNR